MPKPVVFVPGYPASKLKLGDRTIFPPSPLDLTNAAERKKIVDALADPKFNDPADPVQPSEPIRGILRISKLADALYDLLSGRFGYELAQEAFDFRAVGWDWRKSVDDDQTRGAVRKAINDLFDHTGRKVVLMPHSTGGLVVRRLLEAEPALQERVEQIISFGIPWCGTLASLHVLTDPAKIGLFEPLALSKDEVERVMTHAQAAYDLLPPDPAQTEMDDVDLFLEKGKRVAPLLRNAWMRLPHMTALGDDAQTRLGKRARTHALPPVTNVVGFGAETITRADLKGAKVTYQTSTEGDGTIPLVSAQWLRGDVRTMHIPIGAYPTGAIPRVHSRIWDSPPVIQLLTEVLEDAPRLPFFAVAIDGDDFSNPAKKTFRVRYTACDAKGSPLPNLQATFKFGGARTVTKPIAGVIGEFELSREGLKPNVNGTRFFRLEIEFRWDGGRTKPNPVVIFNVL